MPKLGAYCVRDAKAEAYMRPFFAPTAGFAIRTFSEWANDGESPVAKHPEDYMLFAVGQFDEEAGMLIPAVQPQSLGSALEYVSKPRLAREG